jgi:NADPH:quinone reductase
MTHAIRIHETGGPEVLKWESVPVPDPAPGQVRIRHHAVGLNFLEVNFRAGVYNTDLPFTPGNEGAGEIVAVGDGVDGLKPGDRVAYGGPLGSYCEERVIAADRVVTIPDDLDYRTAAAMMFKGMTARYLLRETFPLAPGHTILFHAAAGGVGLIACQWANALGATVIGTVGSPEKAAIAKAHGCHHTIDYRTEDFVGRVRDLTGGKGVDVVYDSVGKDTFPGSLDCLAQRGLWVLFGRASGSPPPLDMAMLAQKGSLYATRPTLFNHIAERAALLANTQDLFAMVTSGKVRIEVNRTYPLRSAAEAHRDLETRRTTGASVLLP